SANQLGSFDFKIKSNYGTKESKSLPSQKPEKSQSRILVVKNIVRINVSRSLQTINYHTG
ncbi:MAG: hypothetical protein ACO2ZZ_08440, partial [Cyclobacteriaceae bacterium]